jgi:hypothetical protein
MREALTPITCSSWNAALNLPASIKSFATVLIDTSARRETERMDEPSHSILSIWARAFIDSLFMLKIYELLCVGSSILIKIITLAKGILNDNNRTPDFLIHK